MSGRVRGFAREVQALAGVRVCERVRDEHECTLNCSKLTTHCSNTNLDQMSDLGKTRLRSDNVLAFRFKSGNLGKRWLKKRT